MSDRTRLGRARLGRARIPAPWLVLGAGLLVVLAAQVLSPVAAPLYDGLIVLGPYHYLDPGPGQTGSPTSATVTEAVSGGSSPGFNAATTETVPQAQLIAAPGAFALGPGSTSVTISITPVEPQAPSTVGPILGNVYRFAVTDQAGTALVTSPGIDVTLVLRAPDATSNAVFAQYSASGTAGWKQLSSSPSGTPGFFIAMTGGGGDYALVEASGGFGPVQAAIVTVAVTAILAVIAFFLIRRRRRGPPAAPVPAPARARTSTTNRKKRKRR